MKVLKEIDLRDYISINIPSLCNGIVWIEGEGDKDKVLEFLKEESFQGSTLYLLGRGSNIVPGRERLPYMFFSLMPLYEPRVVGQGDARTIVRVHGGLSLKRLLLWCRRNGLSGLEPLAGIPGTVGGAIAMNAGSFGREMADVVLRVRVWGPSIGDRWLEKKDISWGYRRFSLPGEKKPFIVWEVEIGLCRIEKKDLRTSFKNFYLKKKTSQPLTHRSCGCLFKNPSLAPAGYLLEKCGLKGFRVGDMQLSEIHANFLINLGKGTPSQVVELVEETRMKVKDRFGCLLEPEVKILGWED